MKALLALLAVAAAAFPPPGPWDGIEVRRGLVYSRACGEVLTLDAYLPEGKGPFPGVLVIHGGGWSARRPADMVLIARGLARRGFVALNVTYRLAPADRFPAAVDDVREALRWARAEASALKLDPERMGAWGYSAGAHLAAMLGVGGFEDPGPGDRLKAVVAGGLPADLARYPKSPIITPFLGKTYVEDPALWADASPVSYASVDDPPFFLYHGDADALVGPEQPRAMAEALARVGVSARIHWIEGRGHVGAFVFGNGAVAEAMSFLAANL